MQIFNGLIGSAFICLGISMLKWPRKIWHLTQGWWAYDNPQEVRLSDGYMLLNAVGAFSAMLVGTVILILTLLGLK